jgi:hypothetical protein
MSLDVENLLRIPAENYSEKMVAAPCPKDARVFSLPKHRLKQQLLPVLNSKLDIFCALE